jgi:hypothetical protein
MIWSTRIKRLVAESFFHSLLTVKSNFGSAAGDIMSNADALDNFEGTGDTT